MPKRLALDPKLDLAALAATFAGAGRIHIPGFLVEPDAKAVAKALAAPDFPWAKSLIVKGVAYDAELSAWDDMPADQRLVFDAAVNDGARTGFQYRFDAWRLSDRREAGEAAGGPLAPVEAVWDLLNSEAFLGFIRDLTGDPRPEFCDAQATRYRPGDFLTVHSDAIEGKNRLYAYVLNFTPGWRADWGGLARLHRRGRPRGRGLHPALQRPEPVPRAAGPRRHPGGALRRGGAAGDHRLGAHPRA